MQCINFRIRSENYKKYFWCVKNKQNKVKIQLSDCNNCKHKIYKFVKPMKRLSTKQAKAREISSKVRKIVFERDKGKCIICGNNYNVMPHSHYIPRSLGGLGIEENIFTICTNFTDNKCHDRWERNKCTKEETQRVVGNFKHNYPNWNEDMLYYHK